MKTDTFCAVATIDAGQVGPVSNNDCNCVWRVSGLLASGSPVALRNSQATLAFRSNGDHHEIAASFELEMYQPAKHAEQIEHGGSHGSLFLPLTI
jgi:hypothetical protein